MKIAFISDIHGNDVALHRVPYPLAAFQDAVHRSTMPRPGDFLAGWSDGAE